MHEKILQVVVNVEFKSNEYFVGCAATSIPRSAHTCRVCRELRVVKTCTDNHARYWSRTAEALHVLDIFGTEITHTSITTLHRLWHWILLTARNPQTFTTCGVHCCLNLYILMSVLLPHSDLNYFGEESIQLRQTYIYVLIFGFLYVDVSGPGWLVNNKLEIISKEIVMA